MDEENIIKKKHNNYYRHHHNQNNYYRKKKKKVLVLDNNETLKIENILLTNEEDKPPVIRQVIEENVPDYEEEDIVPIKKTKKLFSKGFFGYGLGFAVLVFVVFGVSYSYFNYQKEDTRQADITSGEVYVRIPENTANLTLNKVYPRTIVEARARNDNYVDFTVNAKNTSLTNILRYTINIANGEDVSGKTRINPQYLLIDLQEKVGNEYNYIKEAVPLSTFSFSGTIPCNTTSEITKEYRLRVWVSDSIIISDTEQGAIYTQAQFANLYANMHIEVNSVDQPYITAYSILAKTAQTNNSINFSGIASESGGNRLFILKGTDNNPYPIYYYRGGGANNNVIFGGFCWQIVRTTDTGGIKMIYNGVATGNGETCENTSRADRVLVEGSALSSLRSSISDVGYMSNERYPFTSTPAAESNSIFGKNVEWVNNNYLVIENTSGVASTNTTQDNEHHYSCGTQGTSQCPTVRYYYTSTKFIVLSGGDNIEDALYKMTGTGSAEVKAKNNGYVLNVNDSSMKIFLEDWFETNLTNIVDSTKQDLRDFIEDTVYCNDRSFKTVAGNTEYATFSGSGWNPVNGDLTKYLYFGEWNRYRNNWYSANNVPDLSCPNETDRFSVSNNKAKLNYPIGLLTTDEVILAGASGNDGSSSRTYYLYIDEGFSWLMTPCSVFSGNASGAGISSAGNIVNDYVNIAKDVRPVISLKNDVVFEEGGDGSTLTPFVVKINE